MPFPLSHSYQIYFPLHVGLSLFTKGDDGVPTITFDLLVLVASPSSQPPLQSPALQEAEIV